MRSASGANERFFTVLKGCSRESIRWLIGSALVHLGPNGKVQSVAAGGKTPPVRVVQRKLTANEIDSALQTGSLAGVITSEERGAPRTWLIAGLGSMLFLMGFVALRKLSTVRG